MLSDMYHGCMIKPSGWGETCWWRDMHGVRLRLLLITHWDCTVCGGWDYSPRLKNGQHHSTHFLWAQAAMCLHTGLGLLYYSTECQSHVITADITRLVERAIGTGMHIYIIFRVHLRHCTVVRCTLYAIVCCCAIHREWHPVVPAKGNCIVVLCASKNATGLILDQFKWICCLNAKHTLACNITHQRNCPGGNGPVWVRGGSWWGAKR